MKCVKITINGNVQGHGFRFSAAYYANSLGINGYVEYDDLNCLIIVAQGNEGALVEFTDKIKSWSHYPLQLDIYCKETEMGAYNEFIIKNSKIIEHNEIMTKKHHRVNHKIYNYLTLFLRHLR